MNVRAAATLFLLVCCAPVSAQIIAVKTYPILAGETFLPLPSERESMGGISIAVTDRLRDPFINPAELANAERSSFTLFLRRSRWQTGQQQSTASSQENNIWTRTSENGRYASNVSVPASLVVKYGDVAIGASGSYQHLVSSAFSMSYGSNHQQPVFSETIHRADNYPYQLSAAMQVPGTGISVGAGFAMTHIQGVDGMQFLYPDAERLEVSGNEMVYRIGITHRRSDSSRLGIVAGRQTYETYQHAEYSGRQTVHNQDKNRTWFAQVQYQLPLSASATIGLLATGNWKEHPKIPDYPITGVPRDPGTTGAYDIGAGIAWRTGDETLLALEYVIEPITSETWVEAEQQQQIDGRTIHVGDVTQRNNYTFLNHIVRVGAELRPTPWLAVRFGTALHSYSYDYEFIDPIRESRRHVTPQMEWTEIDITGGISASLCGVELAYHGGVLFGAGVLERDNPRWGWDNSRFVSGSSSFDFFLPPNPWVQLRPATRFTHQISARYSFDLF